MNSKKFALNKKEIPKMLIMENYFIVQWKVKSLPINCFYAIYVHMTSQNALQGVVRRKLPADSKLDVTSLSYSSVSLLWFAAARARHLHELF